MTTHRGANSLKLLLAGLVDYAGLFPPAELAMKPAVESFAAHRRDEFAWMLGRFICSATRLSELSLADVASDGAWRISALLGSDVAGGMDLARAFNQRLAGRAVVDSVEFKAETADSIGSAADVIQGAMAAYCEIPISDASRELLEAVSSRALRAKIRTGGLTAAAFPSSAQLARFLTECAEASVPFKATAGLHHPLRGEFQLTYESGSPRATMHGFLNLFLAAAFARAGWSEDQIIPVLEETSPAAFGFTDERASWQGHSLAAGHVQETRNHFALAFGSCSFDEPVAELREMELI